MNSSDRVLNTLTMHHQNGTRRFQMTKGGYHFVGKSITISVETELEDEDFPNCALFSLVDFPEDDKSLQIGQSFHLKDDHKNGWDADIPHANAYFGFHANHVNITFIIVAIEGDLITFELSAMTEDVDYYDDRAKLTPTVGLFQLSTQPMSELWTP